MVIKGSRKEGNGNESITRTLLEGTYYIRAEAQGQGENEYVLSYGVAEANPDKVEELREGSKE